MSLIGGNMPRVDVWDKCTGAATYVDDISLPRMAYGKVVRSPYPHAWVKDVKADRARAVSGVLGVYSHRDVPQVKYNPAGYPPCPVPGRLVLPEDMMVLTDKARFVGDPVALIVAVDAEAAEEAARLVEIEYEILPAVFSVEEALLPGAPQLHEWAPNNLVHKYDVSKGDVEKGFKEAYRVFEEVYTTSKTHASPIEPASPSIGVWKPNSSVTVYSSTQTPHVIRRTMGRVLGLPVGKVHIIRPHVGGGFGAKHGILNELMAAWASKMVGRPVKIIYDREESLIGTQSRHPAVIRLKTGVTRDGMLTAREAIIYGNTGAYATCGAAVTRLMGTLGLGTYHCDNIRWQAYVVYTNTPTSGAYRGYGNPQGCFASEGQMDWIAKELRIDPVDLRLRNAVKRGEPHFSTGLPIESCGLEKCIKLGAEQIGWEERKNRKRDACGNGRYKTGFGLAAMTHVSGSNPGLPEVVSVTLKVDESGIVTIATGASELGQGISTSLATIAAETIGVPFENVVMASNGMIDTDLHPYDNGAYASRELYSAGNVVLEGSRILKDKLIEAASEKLEAAKDRLTVKDGAIIIDGSSRGPDVGEIAGWAKYRKKGAELIVSHSVESKGNPPTFGSHFVEVEVDTLTGAVAVKKLIACLDVGRAINRAIVEGQIEGGAMQGIGYALTEELVIDQVSGKTLTANFGDYKLATASDVPEELKSVIVEDPSETGPFGAKGVGESGLVPTAAAIRNAVYDATGVRINDLPLTPERVWRALKDKGGCNCSE